MAQTAEEKKEYMRKWRAANRERLLELKRVWRSNAADIKSGTQRRAWSIAAGLGRST